MATPKKAAKAAATKVLTPSKKPSAPQKPSAPNPQLGDTVKVHTADGSFDGKATGVHGGLRLDMVVVPAAGSPYSLPAVPHISNSENLPYWE